MSSAISTSGVRASAPQRRIPTGVSIKAPGVLQGHTRRFLFRHPGLDRQKGDILNFSPPRPASPSKTRLKAKAACNLPDPIDRTVRRSLVDAISQLHQLAVRLRPTDPFQPILRFAYRRWRKPTILTVLFHHADARPRPVFCTFYQTGAKRIPLDVAQDGQQMVILFDGKGFKASLPYVAARFVVLVIAANVRRQKPLHPSAEISVRVGPKSQVKVIGNHAVTQHSHRNAPACAPDQLHKRVVVSIFPKYFLLGVAAIDDVVAYASD